MTPDQQLLGIFISAIGSIVSTLISVFFSTVFIPMLEAIISGIFNPTP